MLSFLALLGNPVVRYVALGVAVWAAVQYVRWDAARDATKALELKIERALAAERARIQEANDKTVSEFGRIAGALTTQTEAIQKRLEENDEEARKDPAANSCGIGADSVRRLNRIGPSGG